MRGTAPKVVAAGALLALTLLVTTVGMAMHPPDGSFDHRRAPVLLAVAWLAFGAGAWLVWRLPVRVAVPLLLVGAVGLQLAAGFAPPRSSDDMYRYVWDGRVQAAGVDPYRYPPAAPELAGQRDHGFLWPDHASWCVPSGCTLMNRPDVPTIYPPVAEAYFTVVHWLSPPGSRTGPMQLAAAILALATTVLLLFALRAAGIDPRRAVLWAWCPTVAVEAANNAHVDVLGVFLTGVALFLLARGRVLGGGVVFGLAVATKFTPALIAPALARRKPVVVALVAALTVLLVYLPHIAVVGPHVLGYLPGYLREEGYSGGQRFALVTLLVPQAWAAPLAAVLLALVAVQVARRADPDRPWDAALVMTGAALLAAAPEYPWYATLVVLLLAYSGRPEWLGVSLAGYLVLYAADIGMDAVYAQRIGYGGALLAVLVATAVRRLGSPVQPTGGRPAFVLRRQH